MLTAGVGTAGLRNAAIAACQILAATDPQIGERLDAYLADHARPVHLNISLDGA